MLFFMLFLSVSCFINMVVLQQYRSPNLWFMN